MTSPCPAGPAFKVPMMNNTFVANYMENANFQLAQFMYKDNEVSVVVILPKKMDGLPEVENELSAKGLSSAGTLPKGGAASDPAQIQDDRRIQSGRGSEKDGG